MTKTILICTGNYSRSQIAEGFSNYYGNQIWSFTSVGSNPIALNKNKIHTMDEIVIDVRHQNSKSLKLFDLSDFNYVITLCGDAKNHCPAIPKGVHHQHWDLPDPAQSSGNNEDFQACS